MSDADLLKHFGHHLKVTRPDLAAKEREKNPSMSSGKVVKPTFESKIGREKFDKIQAMAKQYGLDLKDI